MVQAKIDLCFFDNKTRISGGAYERCTDPTEDILKIISMQIWTT